MLRHNIDCLQERVDVPINDSPTIGFGHIINDDFGIGNRNGRCNFFGDHDKIPSGSEHTRRLLHLAKSVSRYLWQDSSFRPGRRMLFICACFGAEPPDTGSVSPVLLGGALSDGRPYPQDVIIFYVTIRNAKYGIILKTSIVILKKAMPA